MNTQQDNNKAQFENSDVDPGFSGHEEDKLKGREDKREHNIDSNLSIKEMREGKTSIEGDNPKEDDALNYKNDREHGAFNPKNI
ncbi:hypothetical protein [Pedobacter ginsengisoli]|uniref:hypothetical protein n=1 Tax=Pedobacter ginsengisoli TaxID=363852 RepID=UPI00254FCC97|nr:hypothetical protein [Pedobacter ginsengisoli]